MNSYILIEPNPSDNWIVSSPFSTALTLASVTDIPGLVTDMSDINRSIDIDAEPTSGVGGVCKSGDFDFTLVNDPENPIDVTKLIGRKVIYCVDFSDSVEYQDPSSIDVRSKFIGYIYSVEPSRFSLKFNCRSMLSKFKSNQIGVLSESTNELYKGSIIPITYGENIALPAIMQSPVSSDPVLLLGDKSMGPPQAITFVDDGTKDKYESLEVAGAVQPNTGNTQIILNQKKILGSILVEAIDDSTTTIKLYNPFKLTFQLDSLPAGLTPRSGSFPGEKFYLIKGGIYYWFELLSVDGSFLTFSSGALEPPPKSGNIIRQTGSTSHAYQFVSDRQPPELNFYLPDEEMIDTSVAVSAKPDPFVIKIDDESMLITEDLGTTLFLDIYSYTSYKVIRGYSGTEVVAHALNSEMLAGDLERSGRVLVRKTVYPTAVKGIGIVTGNVNGTTQGAHTYSPIRPYLNVSGLERLLYKSLNINKSNANDEVTTLSVDMKDIEDYFSGYVPSGLGDTWGERYGIFQIDLEFPKIDIEGELVNIYPVGFYSTFFDNLTPSDHEITASLGWGKGAMPYPNAPDYYNLQAFQKAKNDINHLSYMMVGQFYKQPNDYDVNVMTSYPLEYLVTNPLSYELGDPDGTWSSGCLASMCKLKDNVSYDRTRFYFNNYREVGWLANEYPKLGSKYYSVINGLDFGFKTNNIKNVWGVVPDLAEFNRTRYFIQGRFGITYGQTTTFLAGRNMYFNMSGVGLVLEFYVNPLKYKAWPFGSGRLSAMDFNYPHEFTDSSFVGELESSGANEIILQITSISGKDLTIGDNIGFYFEHVNTAEYGVKEVDASGNLLGSEITLGVHTLAQTGSIGVAVYSKGEGFYNFRGYAYIVEEEVNAITNPVAILEDLLLREVGVDVSSINISSFRSVFLDRSADKWKSKFVLKDQPKEIYKAFDDLARQAAILLGESNDGELYVKTLSKPAVGELAITDSELLLDSSKVLAYKESYTSIDKLFSSVNLKANQDDSTEKYGYSYKYSGSMGLDAETVLYNNGLSLDVKKEVTVSLPDLQLSGDQYQSADILSTVVDFCSTVRRTLEVDVLPTLDVNVGSWVYLSTEKIDSALSSLYFVLESNYTPGLKEQEPKLTLKLLEFENPVVDDSVIEEVPYSENGGWFENYTELSENQIEEGV
jgi:hypothetical protein